MTPTTAILLCSDLAGDGLDLDELRSAVIARIPEVTVSVVDQLCERPGAAVNSLRATGATRAVLGVCRHRLPEAELRARARSGGSGTHDLELVRVPRTRGPNVAASTLAAAALRLVLTPPGEPSRAVPTAAGLSRGALFRVAPAVSLQPVAVVDAGRCTGFSRCGLCADACPAHAISPRDDKASVTAAACETCGRCLAACPAGAVHIGGATTEQLEAQLTVLLDEPRPVGVLFACAGAIHPLDDEPALDDWSVVELPALSIATPGWVLQVLAAGTARVHLHPCAGDCCSVWHEGGASLELCRLLLPAALAGCVTVGGLVPSPRQTLPRSSSGHRLGLAEPQATAAALRALGGPEVRVTHRASPLGLVELDPGCTTCGACASACPVAALELAEGEDALVLQHDPALCTGCGLCARVCPERVVHVTRGLDTARLAAGRLELASTRRQRCRRCGAFLPPSAIVDRNRRLLAGGWPLLAGAPGDLCLPCARVGDTIGPFAVASEERNS